MSVFITRVELHNVDTNSALIYEILHESMKKVGFRNTLWAKDNHNYELQPAEYVTVDDFDCNAIASLAKTAVQTTGAELAFLHVN